MTEENLPTANRAAEKYAVEQALAVSKALVEDVNLARRLAYASKDQRDDAARQRREAAKVQTYLEAGITTEGASLTITSRGEYLADKNHAHMQAIKIDGHADMIEQDVVDLHNHQHSATRVTDVDEARAMAVAGDDNRREASALREHASLLINSGEMAQGPDEQYALEIIADDYIEDAEGRDQGADLQELAAQQAYQNEQRASGTPKAS